jgi:predicted kinase
MPSVTIVRGLPSCGKTTWAREWVEQDPTIRVRVSRPDLAAMAGGAITIDLAKDLRDAALARLLAADLDVVVDDIHLSQHSVQEILDVARRYQSLILVYDMSHIPLDEVFRRNSLRDRPVPEDVIAGYHRTFVAGQSFPLPIPPAPEPPEMPEVYVPIDGTPTYLVDVDRTVALHGERGPFDWDAVGQDMPNGPVIELLEALDGTGQYQFVFLSGRPEKCREATEKWLSDHVGVEWGRLFMRDTGDSRPDHVVKLEIFDREIRERYNIVGVFDDRNKVVSMWRSLGLTVFQVADGDF